MTIEQMRDYISRQYNGDKWKNRCKTMRPSQVMGIYYSMQSRDRDKEKKASQIKKDAVGVQLTIFDLLKNTIEEV